MHFLWSVSEQFALWLDREAPGLIIGGLIGGILGMWASARYHRRYLRHCYYENWVKGFEAERGRTGRRHGESGEN